MTTNNNYRTAYSYDPNGNILRLLRYSTAPNPIDSLGYFYYADTNKLTKISENVSAMTTTVDIDNQTNDENYVYDEIGNLITDKSENITSIKWNVYGKIEEINKTGTANSNIIKIEYSYDSVGNRVGKIVHRSTGLKEYTTYVRDSSGNVLDLYTTNGTTTVLSNLVLNMAERHIYGSSRIGAYNNMVGVDGGASDISWYNFWSSQRGVRKYELTNHLGNVLSMVLDKTEPIVSSDNSTKIGYNFLSLTHSSYYPFGMQMVTRTNSPYSATSSRYGFNGQEKSDEISGAGNSYTAEFWQYDPRIGRRWNVDPVVKDDESPYMTFGNNPIVMIDPNGADWYKNKKSGSYEWIEGSGRQKGYKHMKTGTWSERNKDGFSYYFGNSKYDLIMSGPNSVLDGVVVTAKAPKRGINYGLKTLTKSETQARRTELYTNFQKFNSGESIDAASLKYISKEYLQNYTQAEQDWRMMSGVAVGSLAAPFAIGALSEMGAVHYGGHLLRWAFTPKANLVSGLADASFQYVNSGGDLGRINLASVFFNTFSKGGLIKSSIIAGAGSSIFSVTSSKWIQIQNPMSTKLIFNIGGNMIGGALGKNLGLDLPLGRTLVGGAFYNYFGNFGGNAVGNVPEIFEKLKL